MRTIDSVLQLVMEYCLGSASDIIEGEGDVLREGGREGGMKMMLHDLLPLFLPLHGTSGSCHARTGFPSQTGSLTSRTCCWEPHSLGHIHKTPITFIVIISIRADAL